MNLTKYMSMPLLRCFRAYTQRSVLSALLLVPAVLSCSSETPEIRIGMIVPETGARVEGAVSAQRGAELAVQHLEQSGGLNIDGQSYRIRLFVEDNMDNAETAMNATRKLIFQDNVAAIIGPLASHITQRAAPIAENAGIPLISPIATNPEITQDRRFVFRMSFTDAFQARVLARFAGEALNADRAAILFDIADAYNRYMAESFRTYYEELGGNIVAFESYTTDAALHFDEALSRIRDRKAQVLFLPNFPDHVTRQVRQARQLGLDVVFLGGDTWHPTELADVAELDQAYFAHHWHAEVSNPQAEAFTNAYKAAYDVAPTNVAALTYDAFGLLFQAVREEKALTPQAIRDAVSSIANYEGTTGVISYRESGDPIKPIFIFQFQQGRIGVHQMITP